LDIKEHKRIRKF